MLSATDEPSSGGQSRDTRQRKLDYFGYSISLVGLLVIMVIFAILLLRSWHDYLTDSRGELLPVFFETGISLVAVLTCGYCFRLLLVSSLDEALRLPESGWLRLGYRFIEAAVILAILAMLLFIVLDTLFPGKYLW